MTTKKDIHYVVADEDGEYGILHIWAPSREEAAKEYLTANGLEKDSVRIGVTPLSSIVFFNSEPETVYTFKLTKETANA